MYNIFKGFLYMNIKDFLFSIMLLTIEEYNVRFQYINEREKMRGIANEDFSESDFVNKLVVPMPNIANIEHKNRDIYIKNLDFEIEVKYLRNFKSSTGTACKTTWKNIAKDFDWLEREIRKGNKGKRAFIIGWFNVYDYLGEVIQLGIHLGQSPKINHVRIQYFPFIEFHGKNPRNSNYNYSIAYKSLTVPFNADMECIFFGSENDKFHIVMYF